MLGYVVRMEDGRIVKKYFNGKPSGRSKIRRPRLRWLNDVEHDLRGMNVRRWSLKTMNREDWKDIIKEARILNSLKRHKVAVHILYNNFFIIFIETLKINKTLFEISFYFAARQRYSI